MVRIGRQIAHFEGVNPASVSASFSEDRQFRYLLQMQYGGSLYDTARSRKAAVILKNPSAADIRAADSTIRKVETYIYHHLEDVLQLSILNIFGLRATDTLDLNREYEIQGEDAVIGPENDETIRKVIADADYVVVAWGNRSGIDSALYEKRVRDMIALLSGAGRNRVFEVRGKKETVQPLHGMMWGYDYTLVPFLKWKED